MFFKCANVIDAILLFRFVTFKLILCLDRLRMKLIEAEYEDLSRVAVGHSIGGHVKLQDQLVAYLNSEEGRKTRESSERRIILRERINLRGSYFLVETTIRTDNLYVTTVVITDSTTGKEAIKEEDDGRIGGYNQGTCLIPIQFYLKKANSRTLEPFTPGTFIRSQAFRISEALRFRRSMRYTQLTNGRGHAPLWPQFRDTTPFEYANILREDPVDFSMFHVFYNRWEELSREDHPVVAVKNS